MSTLIIDRSATRIHLHNERIGIIGPDSVAGKVPARVIERIVIRGDTEVSASTLAALAERGIAFVALGGRHGERVATLGGVQHADASIRLSQTLAFVRPGLAARIARIIVRRKLREQRRLIGELLASRPDLRKPIFDAGCNLDERLRMLSQRGQAICLERLRGIEGAAAAAYFDAYFRVFPPSLGAKRRTRRPPTDPVNACLSLGYTLLYARAEHACRVTGLDPAIGTLHGLAYGRAALACDLIESERPAIDRLVWRLFADRTLREEHFGTDGKQGVLLGKTGRCIFYDAIEALGDQLQRRLMHQARRLVRHLRRVQAELLPQLGHHDEP